MRLRTILSIVFCMSALAPMIFFWIWPNTRVLDSEKQNAGNYQAIIAQSIAAELNSHLEEQRSIFLSIAYQAVTKDGETQGALSNGHGHYQSICVVDRNSGQLIRDIAIPSRNRSCPRSYTPESLQLIEASIDQHGDEVGTTSIMKDDRGTSVFKLVYGHEDKAVVGSVSLEFVQEIGNRVRFGKAGQALITDQDGVLISHAGIDWQAEPRTLSEIDVIRKALTGETGAGTFFSDHYGMDMLAGYAPASDLGWAVAVFQPLADLEERMNSVKHESLSALGIGLLFAVALAYFASRFLTYPIIQIVQVMERIGNGELRAYESMKDDSLQIKEFSKARVGIKVMADKLQENIDTISQHAYLDGITGLPNRECFKMLAQQEIERLLQSNQKCALLFLDLDGFKQVNDVYGHRSGDDLLKGFADRLHVYCGNEMKRRAYGAENGISIMPARLGGDEFVVFLSNAVSENLVREFAAGLFQRVFGELKLHNGVVINVNGSVGGAVFPDHALDIDELLRLADIAMYKAKNSGKGRFCLHSEFRNLPGDADNGVYEAEQSQAG